MFHLSVAFLVEESEIESLSSEYESDAFSVCMLKKYVNLAIPSYQSHSF